jgi:hypothetical protein
LLTELKGLRSLKMAVGLFSQKFIKLLVGLRSFLYEFVVKLRHECDICFKASFVWNRLSWSQIGPDHSDNIHVDVNVSSC